MNELMSVFARHQHFIERYKTGEFNKLQAFLKRFEDDLIRRLSRSNTFTSQSRITRQLTAIFQSLDNELKAFITQYEANLIDFGVSQGEFSALSATELRGVEFKIPSSSQIKAAVFSRPFSNSLLRDSLDLFSKSQATMIRNNVALGFAEGLTNQEIIASIIGTSEFKFNDGALKVTRAAASRLVRTATQHMASSAQLAMFRANRDIIQEYAWISILDNRTCLICQSRDGKVYEVDSGPAPPAHQNCRCISVPVFDGEVFTDEDGVRRSQIDGKRPEISSSGRGRTDSRVNYGDWLKKQSKSFQVDALGKSRAELFRKGNLKIDKFVDRFEQPLTLDELKSKFPKRWARAGLNDKDN